MRKFKTVLITILSIVLTGCNPIVDEDSVFPVIYDVPTELEVEVGSSVDLLSLGVSATDETDGDITDLIIVNITDTSILDIGTHTVTFSVTNSVGNTTRESFEITVVDVTFIYMIEDNEVTITDYNDTASKDVVIPDYIEDKPVTKIAEGAFYKKGLTSVVIGDNVIEIKEHAFANNELQKVDFGRSVDFIGGYAFENNDVESIYIPSSVTTIRNYSFSNNPLTQYIVDEENSKYKSVDGVLYNKIGTRLVDYPSDKLGDTYTVLTSTISITECAFCDAHLSSITIGDNVETIEYKAFANGRLTSVVIPDSVTYIGSGAFMNNVLNEITLGETVKWIGIYAFRNNELTELHFPDTTEYVAEGAFKDNDIVSVILGSETKLFIYDGDCCDPILTVTDNVFSNNPLEEYIVPEDNQYYQSIDGVLFNKQGNYLYLYPQGKQAIDYSVPEGVKTIGENAFHGSTLLELTISSSVTEISEHAFEGNPLIRVTILGDESRFDSSWESAGLPHKDLPNFYFPFNDVTITLGTSYELLDIDFIVGDLVDGVITSSVTVNIEDTSILEVGEYTIIYSVIDSDGNENELEKTLRVIDNVFTYVIENNEITILNYSDLGSKDVIIPSNINGFKVTKINEDAFNTKQLNSVLIPNSVIEIGENAFSNNLVTEIKILGDETRFNDSWNVIGLPDELMPLEQEYWR